LSTEHGNNFCPKARRGCDTTEFAEVGDNIVLCEFGDCASIGLGEGRSTTPLAVRKENELVKEKKAVSAY
jgi:hypothetical protein